MLFGNNNPWLAGRRIAPPAQPTTQPTAQPPQYAAPTWPGATPDGAYANGLASYYANQLQNQMVPGSIPPPTQGPTGSPQTNPALPPVAAQPGDWRSAFRQALGGWRQDRPQNMLGVGGLMQWIASRPTAQSFRMGGQ